MIVKDLSKSFHPVPKNKNIQKEIECKQMKKKSKKLAKLEKNRFSIITNNLEICYICQQNKKEDFHEVYEGKNRQISMKYGLVIPICRKCHKKITNNKNLQDDLHKKVQKIFKKHYKDKDFIKIFGKNYI